MNSCCFTGHRDLPVDAREQILPVLIDKIEELINEGVAVFINGGALGFDTLSALAVLGLKNRYPNDVYQEILGNCDTKICLGCSEMMSSEYVSKLLRCINSRNKHSKKRKRI